jgi:hypothetical protein
MKFSATLIAAAFSTVLGTSPLVQADVQPVGKVVVGGGAEKESGTPAGARGTLELLGVVPLSQNFGLQSSAHYVGGRGSRFGLSAGPIYSWGSGKAGLFAAYQYRTFNDNHFVHLRPSFAFYLPQANVNLFYSHPVSSPQRDSRGVEYGVNHLQTTISYFPASDWASFLRKDNVELMFGLQANSFAGPGSGKLSTGVGPVFGFAFMPAQNVEVNLVKGTVDHHGRYRIISGLSYYFNRGAATLKELRRRYLEPNFFAPNAGGRVRKTTAAAPVITSLPVLNVQ